MEMVIAMNKLEIVTVMVLGVVDIVKNPNAKIIAIKFIYFIFFL